jgi:hypothetical protein
MPHKDPAVAKQYQAAYRKAHREEAAERTRLWRLAHPGENARLSRSWRKINPETKREKNRKWRAKNRDRVRETQRAWRARNKYSQTEKRKAGNARASLRFHGMTIEDYEQMLAAQDGGCAICGSKQAKMRNAKRLYVDHCHKSDRVRGLLCFPCNSLLSQAGDSSVVLRRAAEYLERPNDSGIVRAERRRLLESK